MAWGVGNAKYPGAGLFDGQNIVAGDLELDLHCEGFVGSGVVQTLEMVMDILEMPAQLVNLSIAHEELSSRHLVGGHQGGV